MKDELTLGSMLGNAALSLILFALPVCVFLWIFNRSDHPGFQWRDCCAMPMCLVLCWNGVVVWIYMFKRALR